MKILGNVINLIFINIFTAEEIEIQKNYVTTKQKQDLEWSFSNSRFIPGWYMGESNQINIYYPTSAVKSYVVKQKLFWVFTELIEFGILVSKTSSLQIYRSGLGLLDQ